MARTRSQRIPTAVLESAARVLRVLAHPQRLRLVELLIEQPRPVGRLAEAIGLPQAAVSQHLNNMRAHGIVEGERDGRQVLYRVMNPNAITLLSCLRSHGDGR